MAVMKMKLLSIIGSIDQLDAVLDTCCSSENFHLDQAMSFFKDKSEFVSLNDENPYTFYLNKLSDAVKLARLEAAPVEDSDLLMGWDEIKDYVDNTSAKLTGYQEEKFSLTQEIENVSHSMEQFKHFQGFDMKLDEIFKCEFIKVRFGRLPKESFEKLSMYSDNPYIVTFPCTSDDKYVWGVYMAPIDNIHEVDRIFQSLYWERLKIPDAVGTPEEAYNTLAEQLKGLDERLALVKKKMDDFWGDEEVRCCKVLNYLERHKNNFDLRRYTAKYQHSRIFFLAGWVPAENEKDFTKRLEKLGGIEYKFENASDEPSQTPPVKLKNAGIFKPFEFFVKMYGLPNYDEMDPTPFVAITYFILFGIMFADVGQGLCLSLVTWFFMWKMKKLELGKCIAMCGISSAIFGVLFGSVFGFEDLLNPFWGWVHRKTGVPLMEGKLLDVNELSTELIYAAIGIGVVLVLVAILLNIYTKCKQHKYGNAIFSQNGIAGFLFYGGTIFGVLGQMFLGIPLLTPAYVICMIVIPAILIFLNEPLSELIEGKEDWFPENVGDFLMQNIFEMLEVVLSYVSNTVSFLRVGAFILVHAGMMTVVFTLAGMMSGFGYWVTVILGNIIIMALEGLLVGIQALRLEFYEMFSRFFTGEGRPFKSAATMAEELKK